MTQQTVAPSKSEAVYQELRARIINGELAPGYRIVLDQVARDMDVSPVPVREAVRRLEAEKLVTFTRNVGAEVSKIRFEEYTETFQTLAYLEGAATALAAPYVTDEILEEASDVNAQMRDALEQPDFRRAEVLELNSLFHHLLISPCPNKHLHELIEREWELMGRIRRAGLYRGPGRFLSSVEEHDLTLRLIRLRAPFDEIEAVARQHKMRSLRDFHAEHAQNSMS